MAQVAEALKQMARTPHRLEIIRQAGYTVLDDSYNASPDSMLAALDSLVSITGKRRIAVLAGMNELGEDSEMLHRATGIAVAHANIDLLVAVGDKAAAIADGALEAMDVGRVVRCPSNAAATEFLRSQIEEGDVLLVKGSRTMQTEQIVFALISGDACGKETS
jgi:UDP-N-acetylmuramoyl-tripeptide--D-alanyl-D-alanine ligase